MKLKIIEVKVKRALGKSGLPDIDYALNPYIGCMHGCIYCYARLYTRIKEISDNWGEIVAVKTNLIEVLDRETKYLRKGIVGLGTVTDPYQPVEAIYGLTRKSLELLLPRGFHISIQTKNTLILRDLELISRYTDRIDVGFTITSLDDSLAIKYEPKASPPTMRAEALRFLSRRGIKTWIFYGPVIHGYNDDPESFKEVVELAVDTNSYVLIDRLHVKKFMFNKDHPLYKNVTNTRARDYWRRFIVKALNICRDYGAKCIEGFAEPQKMNARITDYM